MSNYRFYVRFQPYQPRKFTTTFTTSNTILSSELEKLIEQSKMNDNDEQSKVTNDDEQSKVKNEDVELIISKNVNNMDFVRLIDIWVLMYEEVSAYQLKSDPKNGKMFRIRLKNRLMKDEPTYSTIVPRNAELLIDFLYIIFCQ